MKPTTVRLDNEVLERIDGLAKSMSRSRAWVIKEAIHHYLDYEEWFFQSVREGLEAAERGDTMPHDDVMAEVRERVAQKQR